MLCPNCSREMSDDRCENCGFQLKTPSENAIHRTDEYALQSRPPNYAPNYEYARYASRRDDAPLSIGGFIGTFLLSAIPVVGFVLLVFWACSKKVNVNRHNWAVAVLVIWAVMLVFSLGAAIVLAFYYNHILGFRWW